MSASLPALDLLGIGVLGPGLPDWAAAQAALGRPGGWQHGPTPAALPQRLAPAERRRAGAPVKLSLVVADQAVAMSGVDPAGLASVFASSSGDTQNCHLLCEMLASADRLISPTRFTNSVHNAAAGYWHIATTSRAPSTSLCAFDASFGAGLLEAAAQALDGQRPVLLVAADVPYPEPLHAVRPLPEAFAVALLLAPARPGPGRGPDTLARLVLSTQAADRPPTPCEDPGLEALRAAVPAARALPLLVALARGGDTSVTLEALDGLALRLELQVPVERPAGA